jgi:hypothetical protein
MTLTIIATGTPYRSSLTGIVAQSFGAIGPDGQRYSGTAFADGRTVLHPNPVR